MGAGLKRIRKLLSFVRRERRLIDELRPAVGARRALAARARANLELDGLDRVSELWPAMSRIEARIEAAEARIVDQQLILEGHEGVLAPIPAMGRAIEGLAARIDVLDHVTSAGFAAATASSTVPQPTTPAAARPRRARRRVAVDPFPIVEGRLRILGVNEMFPLISETYIREELASLLPFGADLAWYRKQEIVPAPMPVPEPVFTDFDEAIEVVRPDVAFVHWLTAAEDHLAQFERHGLPFGVRAHSFDFDREAMTRLLAHPLCVGGWTYPGPEYAADGAHELAPIIAPSQLPAPTTARRDKVVSASAWLPKKDWPLLLDAFDLIDGADRRLIVGVTIGHEQNPGELAQACAELANPPLLQVNMARDQVLALLAQTAVAIYTLRPDTRFGMPMSIADALCCGCAVIVPDRPEALDYAGPNARPYRSAQDIAAHVHEVLAGGQAIEQELTQNREYGRARFCNPETPRHFDAQLRAGLARVQRV